MFHIINKSCPYEDWVSQASMHCKNPGNFHCVKDEYNRIGWVCAQPIWVEKDRCPVYNIGAEKLDTTSCPQTKCPPYNYRSNDIDVEYACRYLYARPTTIPPFTISNVSSGTNNNNNNNNNNNTSPDLWIILTALFSLVVVVVVIAAIAMLYKRRTKSPQNDDMRLEENNDLLMDKANNSKKAEKQSESFKEARKYLDQKKMVVITGVQGSGKTFLAKELVTDLKNNGNEIKSIWNSNIFELRQNQRQSKEKFDIYVFDGMFYELQMDKKVEEAIEALKKYSNESEKSYLIFTIPSYIWQKHSLCNELESWLGKVRVNLDKRSKSEKRNILTFMMNRHDLPRGQAGIICKLESNLLDFTSNSIGFPALISWICKQSSEDEVKKLLRNPLQSMSDRVALLKNDPTLEEGGKFLILAYMSLKDGKMDVHIVDKKLFESLKKTFVPGFVDKDLEKYAGKMVGYYLLSNEDDGSFEFDLNIMKKIVLVSVAKENALFVQVHCNNDYSKCVIASEFCPDDIDTYYAECYAISRKVRK